MGRRGKSKYKNTRTTLDGVTFASRKEAARYLDLKVSLRCGDISDLKLQPKFWLEINGKPILLKSKGFPNGRRASFKPDFQYVRDGVTTLEDVKSPASRTEAYVLRKGVFEALFPNLKLIEV